MKKTFILFCLLLSVSTAHAITFSNVATVDSSLFSGEYMFTVSDVSGGNDKLDLLNSNEFISGVNSWFPTNHSGLGAPYVDSFTSYGKVEASDLTSGGLSVTYNNNNNSGSWLTDDPIEFYTVKGSTEFALYWMGTNGATTGDWSTQHLRTVSDQQPAISHLSTWNQTTPVPEPSTLLLLGSGVLGLAFYRRKKK